ncbi:MAG: BTAD domain-containing putative transcriptional regulator [Lachnospiraceae bacterium]|nr:BTAD domain-containing putative transcriptional regulator [Lachnospiraceae bacterium]
MSEKIKINMLGEFSISYGDKTINDNSNRSKKIWTLLEYLIVFKNKRITQNDLIDLLWPEDESDNPANALKTLLFRARAVIDELGLSGKTMITYQCGTYSFSRSIPLELDSEKFDSLLSLAESAKDDDEKIDLLTKATKVYKGDFLPKSSLEIWAVPIVTYFHSKYIKAVHNLISLLNTKKMFEEIISLCQQAVNIDSYDENLHYYLIKALADTGAQQRAIQHYNYTKNLFFSHFGVNLSPKFTAVYKEIIKTSKTAETDLGIIRDNLKEEALIKGALFCEYEIFKSIYQLMARSASRTGQSSFLCLITAMDLKCSLPPQKVLNNNMNYLYDAIKNSLRHGDVYTRYSISQYLIMLFSLTYENAEMILGRTTRNFRLAHPHSPVIFSYSIQPLIPIDLETL